MTAKKMLDTLLHCTTHVNTGILAFDHKNKLNTNGKMLPFPPNQFSNTRRILPFIYKSLNNYK